MDLALVGQRVFEMRKASRLSRAKLADLARVHRNTIRNIETASRGSVEIQSLEAIAAALGTTVTDLLGADGVRRRAKRVSRG